MNDYTMVHKHYIYLYKRIGFFSVQNRVCRSVCPSVRSISYWLEDWSDVWLDGRVEGRWVLSLTHKHKWGVSVCTGLMQKFPIGEASGMFALMNKLCQNSGPQPIWLAHCSPNKKKLWRFLKIEGSVLMYIVPPLGPTYIGESAKAYGLKVRCLYGEHVGEQIVNLGNILGTH
jgi:hypothetical protein